MSGDNELQKKFPFLVSHHVKGLLDFHVDITDFFEEVLNGKYQQYTCQYVCHLSFILNIIEQRI